MALRATEGGPCSESDCTLAHAECRDLKETLRRLNKGAGKVADLCGTTTTAAAVPQPPQAAAPRPAADSPAPAPATGSTAAAERQLFRGGIMFCLKDVPAEPGIMSSTIRDFEVGLGSMVSGGDDFVSAIFNNTLAVAAFPSLQQQTGAASAAAGRGAFYLTLRQVRL